MQKETITMAVSTTGKTVLLIFLPIVFLLTAAVDQIKIHLPFLVLREQVLIWFALHGSIVPLFLYSYHAFKKYYTRFLTYYYAIILTFICY